MAARARIGEQHFFDVHHADYVLDPIGILERIYDFLGLQLTAQTRKKMESWHAANASGAHGTHRYTAEQFGLSPAGLRRDYAAYIERYSITIKS